MTYRCEPCGINWAPGQTRKGACPLCKSGTKYVLTASPDPEATDLYRVVVLAEDEAERRRIRNLEFERFYEEEWPAMRPPDVAAEMSGWAGL